MLAMLKLHTISKITYLKLLITNSLYKIFASYCVGFAQI